METIALPRDIVGVKPTPEAVIIETFFQIPNRQGRVVDYKLNYAQLCLDKRWTERNYVPKSRRLGVSAYGLARGTAACLIYENINAVLISHESEATMRLLKLAHFFLDNFRGPPPNAKKNRNRIEFRETGSSFFIGTAGADHFGRGDSIHRLHGSEVAYWPNMEELLGGMIDAVPLRGGEVGLESTGNGYNSYANRCLRAARGEGDQYGLSYKCHFLDWLSEPEHAIYLSSEEEAGFMGNLLEELEEPALVGLLTPAQLVFRRHKIINEYDGDIVKFRQEWPLTLDECFQASGHSMFWKVKYEPTNEWHREDRHACSLNGHPRPGCSYILGADPSGGTGNDNASIQVFCLDDSHQVYEYANDRIPPDNFARQIATVGNRYNGAFCVVENNNHGIVTLSDLDGIYPNHKIYYGKHASSKEEVPKLLKLGFRTTAQSKPLAIGRLQKALSSEWVVHSGGLKDDKDATANLKSELSTFVEDPNGKMGAVDGHKDDRVTAAAMCAVGWNEACFGIPLKAPAPKGEVTFNQFMLDALLEQLAEKEMGGLPIDTQHMVVN